MPYLKEHCYKFNVKCKFAPPPTKENYINATLPDCPKEGTKDCLGEEKKPEIRPIIKDEKKIVYSVFNQYPFEIKGE